jgi:hypothetical protein
MDVTVLKNIVKKQLSGTSGLSSLQLQNHIYGCFLIMEDIAQSVLEYSEYQLIGPSYSFDTNKHFSDIGIRYGFAMDTKLAFTDDTPSYKEAWLQTFQDLSVLKDIECVDEIEECLIEIIQQDVSAEDSYFIHALETGSLPQQWVEKVLSLLQPAPVLTVPVVPAVPVSEESDVSTTQSVISRARTEKPLHKPKRLARTQRHVAVVESATKKHLSKTRKTSK